jgi:regulator of protease activity HflC (stomatin/prohibitin superfamily)
MDAWDVAIVAIVVAMIAALVALARDRARLTIMEHERGLRYDGGRFTGVLGPGRYRRSARIRIRVVDVRPQVLTVGGQEVLTADGISVKISLAVVHAIADPDRAINLSGEAVADVLYVRLQLALRRFVAETSLEDVLADRSGIGARLLTEAAPVAEELGLRLDAVDIKDVMLSGELKRAFAQVTIARQEGLAALERARGETAALRNLANAAGMLDGRPALLQLRLLQELGASTGHTVVLAMGDAAAGTMPIGVVPPDAAPSDPTG